MTALRQFGNFLLFGNLFVSLCAGALTAQTYLLFHIRPNLAYIAFIFFATLCLYNLQRVVLSPAYGQTIPSIRHHWIINHRKTLISLFSLGGAGLLICIFLTGTTFLYIMTPLAIVSVLYFLPGVRLRKIPAVKALMVAFVWATVSLYIPLQLNGEGQLNKELLIIFPERLLFLLSLCIVFNIRDIEHDKLSAVRTIPSLYGIQAGKTVAIVCLLLSLPLSVILYQHSIYSMSNMLAIIISAIITTALILNCRKKSSEYFYLLGIDGMMLLQPLLIYSCNFI
ncbi:MAG: UbiA family prenyltransferase [Bacteroidetes bacterium]|nr:UbiA family prenyltransferase [Bacteroidota bacterium]